MEKQAANLLNIIPLRSGEKGSHFKSTQSPTPLPPGPRGQAPSQLGAPGPEPAPGAPKVKGGKERAEREQGVGAEIKHEVGKGSGAQGPGPTPAAPRVERGGRQNID